VPDSGGETGARGERMEIRMTGNLFLEKPRQMAGTYQITYDVTTPSGKKGTALLIYEYHKRDVLEETLDTTPEIADEVRDYMIEDCPSCSFGFPKEGEKNKNAEKVSEAIKECTARVYESF